MRQPLRVPSDEYQLRGLGKSLSPRVLESHDSHVPERMGGAGTSVQSHQVSTRRTSHEEEQRDLGGREGGRGVRGWCYLGMADGYMYIVYLKLLKSGYHEQWCVVVGGRRRRRRRRR